MKSGCSSPFCGARTSFVGRSGRGIPTSVVDRRIDRYRVFGGARVTLAGQRHFDERQISLPLHSSLSEEDVQQVIAGVRAGW